MATVVHLYHTMETKIGSKATLVPSKIPFRKTHRSKRTQAESHGMKSGCGQGHIANPKERHTEWSFAIEVDVCRTREECEHSTTQRLSPTNPREKKGQ